MFIWYTYPTCSAKYTHMRERWQQKKFIFFGEHYKRVDCENNPQGLHFSFESTATLRPRLFSNLQPREAFADMRTKREKKSKKERKNTKIKEFCNWIETLFCIEFTFQSKRSFWDLFSWINFIQLFEKCEDDWICDLLFFRNFIAKSLEKYFFSLFIFCFNNFIRFFIFMGVTFL